MHISADPFRGLEGVCCYFPPSVSSPWTPKTRRSTPPPRATRLRTVISLETSFKNDLWKLFNAQILLLILMSTPKRPPSEVRDLPSRPQGSSKCAPRRLEPVRKRPLDASLDVIPLETSFKNDFPKHSQTQIFLLTLMSMSKRTPEQVQDLPSAAQGSSTKPLDASPHLIPLEASVKTNLWEHSQTQILLRILMSTSERSPTQDPDLLDAPRSSKSAPRALEPIQK